MNRKSIIGFIAVTFLLCACGGYSDKATAPAITEDGSSNSVYHLKQNMVKHDDETGIDYVSNIIVIYITSDEEDTEAHHAEIEEMFDCKVVGSIPSIRQYQLEVEPFDDYRTMEEFCKSIEELEYVKTAYPDLAIKIETN